MEKVKKLAEDLSEMKIADLVSIAEERAKDFKGIKTNQIRNFYTAITKMKVDHKQGKNIKDDLVLLLPKLAYAAGRKKAVRTNFYPFLKSAIKSAMNSAENPNSREKGFEHFFILVESIVAYHKFYGGE